MKKSILVVICLAAVGFSAFRVYHQFKRQNAGMEQDDGTASRTAVVPPHAPAFRVIDVDALAARMKLHQDLYKQLRDDSLKVYAKRHPVASEYDKPAQIAIRLAAYLWVWDDYYDEGLWQINTNYAEQSAPNEEQEDPLINVFSNVGWYRYGHPTADMYVEAMKKSAEELEQSDYPAAFKFSGYALMVKVLGEARQDKGHKDGMAKSFLLIPAMIDKTGRWYAEMVKAQIPNDLLFQKGKDVLWEIRDDEQSIVLTGSAFDSAFEKENSKSSARNALQGSYYIEYAWTARGSGYANTVSEDAFNLMRERLEKANDILGAAYPGSAIKAQIATRMITVALGLQVKQEQMETWFQRAIAEDPDSYDAYRNKMIYLLPRWYGTPEQLYNFGIQCVKTQNWQAKIPMIYVAAMEYLAENNPKVYSVDGVWAPLENVFRTYLQHYPDSIIYRCKFAKCAALGGHWKVAREQFDTLGDTWSNEAFTETEYRTLRESTMQNTKAN